jgi:hypothetical protein
MQFIKFPVDGRLNPMLCRVSMMRREKWKKQIFSLLKDWTSDFGMLVQLIHVYLALIEYVDIYFI